MKILVTGGTGFLGRRVVSQLAPRHEVRLLVRAGSSRDRFPEGVTFATGDVTDRKSLDAAVAGCDAVVHAAALVKILAPREEFDRINVQGLANVLGAAEDAGLSRALYVSSFIALGPTENGPGGVLDETADTSKDRPWINDYERTKTLADRAARQAIADGAPLTVVYPGVIYGPGEMTEGNIVLRHVLDLLHRKLPGLVGKAERRWNYVRVEDVASGIVAALETGKPGARYVLGGENVTLGDFYALIERLSGVPMPKRRFPDAIAKAAGGVQKALSRLTGKTPQLTPDLVEIYRHDWAYSSARAAADLGYRPAPLAQGLADSLLWLQETGRWRR